MIWRKFAEAMLLTYVWWFGIRFYQMKVIPSNAEVMKHTFAGVEGHKIEILFYREIYDDHVYRFGRFFPKRKESFIVEGNFDDIPPNKIQRFNRIRYTFNSWIFRQLNNEVVAFVLTSVYINFITNELKKEHIIE